jgi:hypothetical protein
VRAVAALALAASAACGIPDEGPAMRPGQDCLSCHNGDIAKQWTVAGTVYSDPNAPIEAGEPGAQVIVTDANQRVLTLTTNEAGNFYTAEMLVAPLSVQIQRGTYRMVMDEAPATGSCNSCHTIPVGDPDAPGRLFVPFQQNARSPRSKHPSLLEGALAR